MRRMAAGIVGAYAYSPLRESTNSHVARISFFASWHILFYTQRPPLTPFSPSCASRATSVALRRGQCCLLRVPVSLEVTHFKRFLIHLSGTSFLRPVCFAAVAFYPAGIGNASIRRTMAPNNRRVSPLSANSSQ